MGKATPKLPHGSDSETRKSSNKKSRAYEFSGLSESAGVLFVEINRVTDLPPARNMTRTSFDMDPFVVISLGKKTYKTKVVRHDLNPVWDEKFIFPILRHETNYSLNFDVVDRDKLSGNDYVALSTIPLEKISSSAPTADPATELYAVKGLELREKPLLESRRSRFRLPLSRSSSAQNVPRLGLKKSISQASLSTANSNDAQTAQAPTSTPAAPSVSGSTLAPPSIGADSIAAASTATATASPPELEDDPDLKQFELPLALKIKDRWEEKHKPVLYFKAKYLPYTYLRQQFWRALLKQYDTDDSGYMSKIEFTTMLDTLGSTLHESTIDGFFQRFEKENSSFDEPALTMDQAVRCLEDWLKHESASHVAIKSTVPSRAPSPSPPKGREGMNELEKLRTRESTKSDTNSPAVIDVDELGPDGEEGEYLEGEDLADDKDVERVAEIKACPICHEPRPKKVSDADIITHIATCASQDWRKVNNIVMGGFTTASQARRKWFQKVISKVGFGGYKVGANSANILVQDRTTGQINEEKMSIYVRLGIRLLYKGLKSREMEKKRIRKMLRSMSFKQGRKFDDPASAADIEGFINFHQLDMTEVKLPIEQFKSFNEFFYRELKPDARPCSAPDRPEIITSPADCRTVVFNRIDEAQKIWVKGREFSVKRLLGNAYPEDASRYTAGGALGIFRLAPQDYHRFHIPVDGVLDTPKTIEGEYYTVNPMAIRSALDVYGENIRVLCPIDSTHHGRVMVICVGAMMVGSTVITRNKGDNVHRAEELGYFKFGGSTVLLLFEPGVVQFDSDLTDNSNDKLETLVKVGMSIGHAPDKAPHTADMQKKHTTSEELADAKRRIEGSQDPDAGAMSKLLGPGSILK